MKRLGKLLPLLGINSRVQRGLFAFLSLYIVILIFSVWQTSNSFPYLAHPQKIFSSDPRANVVIPSHVIEPVLLLRERGARSFAFSPGILLPTRLGYLLTYSAWPISLDPNSTNLIALAEESIPDPKCRLVQTFGKTALYDCK